MTFVRRMRDFGQALAWVILARRYATPADATRRLVIAPGAFNRALAGYDHATSSATRPSDGRPE